MNCYYHPDTPAVAQCSECGRFICSHCISKKYHNFCKKCARSADAQAAEENRRFIRRTIIIFVVAFLAIGIPLASESFFIGISAGVFAAYGFASIPTGWRRLSNIQPSMFLFLPLIGWLIYFGIKLFLSIFIGFFTMPLDLIKAIKKL